MAAAVAIFTGAVFTGCGSGDGGVICTGNEVSADNGPAAPKEAVAWLKFADREVPLYEYTGAVIPALEGKNTNLAVTKDAIYGIRSDAEEKNYRLQKLTLKDGAIASVEDLGIVLNEPISSDGKNIYYLTREDELACYNGKAATLTPTPGIGVVRAIYGGKNAYTSGSFVSDADVMFGATSKDGIKDAKTVLSKDLFDKLARAKDATHEANAFLIGADADGFYVSSLATYGNTDKEWTKPLHTYAPDGKILHTFECNENIPSSAQKRTTWERSVVVTKDYVVFYSDGYLRAFNKKTGAYVGDIELGRDSRKLSPTGVTTDDENHIYFIDDNSHIYRIDL